MADIVLTTLNAKFIHTALGLRYLLANLGDLRPRAALLEADINQRPLEVVEALLAREPKIVGLGVYIWNVTPATELVAILKRLKPEVLVVLGGPEVSYETGEQEIARLADCVITGEADLKFAELCRDLLAGHRPARKVSQAEPPDLSQVGLPYDLYDAHDLAHRVIYAEASRGCPFQCEFCLSSLSAGVRHFPLPKVLAGLSALLQRGAHNLKFVDRTFNLDVPTARTILEFFLERLRPDLSVHFEIVPDRLPEALREVIVKFPPGALRFEVGLQTFNAEAARLISRRQDYAAAEQNVRFLRQQTGAHLHADLVAGLPGETLESFGAGFDRLVALAPQEIQVGILKRLRGAPISRHDAQWEMVYSPTPPYQVLRNKLLDFPTMRRLQRFARFWEMIGNSGNFLLTTPLLWSKPRQQSRATRSPGPAGAPDPAASPPQDLQATTSPFAAFMRLSDWLYGQAGRQHSIALPRLAEFMFTYLTRELGHDAAVVAETIKRDYQRRGRPGPPAFLKELD
jgi:radical SAM superfamily enzyme YgiQ (UPF0313 family)